MKAKNEERLILLIQGSKIFGFWSWRDKNIDTLLIQLNSMIQNAHGIKNFNKKRIKNIP